MDSITSDCIKIKGKQSKDTEGEMWTEINDGGEHYHKEKIKCKTEKKQSIY